MIVMALRVDVIVVIARGATLVFGILYLIARASVVITAYCHFQVKY